jgi:hypothetical protein
VSQNLNISVEPAKLFSVKTIRTIAVNVKYICVSADCVSEIDAQRVLGYAIFKDGKSTKLSYPLENFLSDVAGRSFHNGRFIQKMRDKA